MEFIAAKSKEVIEDIVDITELSVEKVIEIKKNIM